MVGISEEAYGVYGEDGEDGGGRVKGPLSPRSTQRMETAMMPGMDALVNMGKLLMGTALGGGGGDALLSASVTLPASGGGGDGEGGVTLVEGDDEVMV